MPLPAAQPLIGLIGVAAMPLFRQFAQGQARPDGHVWPIKFNSIGCGLNDGYGTVMHDMGLDPGVMLDINEDVIAAYRTAHPRMPANALKTADISHLGRVPPPQLCALSCVCCRCMGVP